MHASASASAAGDQAWPQASSALGAATRSAVVAATVRELDWLLVEHGAVAAHRGGAAAHALAAGDYVRPQALYRTWALVRRPLAVAVRSAGASMVAFLQGRERFPRRRKDGLIRFRCAVRCSALGRLRQRLRRGRLRLRPGCLSGRLAIGRRGAGRFLGDPIAATRKRIQTAHNELLSVVCAHSSDRLRWRDAGCEPASRKPK